MASRRMLSQVQVLSRFMGENLRKTIFARAAAPPPLLQRAPRRQCSSAPQSACVTPPLAHDAPHVEYPSNRVYTLCIHALQDARHLGLCAVKYDSAFLGIHETPAKNLHTTLPSHAADLSWARASRRRAHRHSRHAPGTFPLEHISQKSVAFLLRPL